MAPLSLLFSEQNNIFIHQQCKNLLDKQIKNYNDLRKLRKKRNGRKDNGCEREIETLIAQLEQLNRAIITSEEYRQKKLKRAGQTNRGP